MNTVEVNHHEYKVSLVGAGTGDPELLTIKGLKALQNAKVILYDALVNPILLQHAPTNSLKIYVGKRANHHRYSQEEINWLLVQYAFSHGTVVRLKGGDPFVFGRGYEELKYVKSFGIQVDIIPGISSSIALAGLQAVPLTHRTYTDSFWVLTATTRTGQLSQDFQLAAQSNATLVVLMGRRKLRLIADLFIQKGKADLPFMLVQKGSTKDEKVVIGTAKTIADLADDQGLGTPAIIVIGKVVSLHPAYCQDYVRQLKTSVA
ncbi:MAG: uroporphyrinogen-III C-methyltransferase [Saprospiraceae bacterium]|nr:uroporphyrinogen-III C-methyltransferase [Saprospiraceae bacterium]